MFSPRKFQLILHVLYVVAQQIPLYNNTPKKLKTETYTHSKKILTSDLLPREKEQRSHTTSCLSHPLFFFAREEITRQYFLQSTNTQTKRKNLLEDISPLKHDISLTRLFANIKKGFRNFLIVFKKPITIMTLQLVL